jgi:hypothetical protein
MNQQISGNTRNSTSEEHKYLMTVWNGQQRLNRKCKA